MLRARSAADPIPHPAIRTARRAHHHIVPGPPLNGPTTREVTHPP
jgi:hypothetical protein